MTTIAVVGLGYVGLPLAVEFGKKYRTIGFDLSAHKIECYKKHYDPTGEVSTDDLKAATLLEVGTDPAAIREADFVVVAVPTPVDDAHQPDFSPSSVRLPLSARTSSKVQLSFLSQPFTPVPPKKFVFRLLKKSPEKLGRKTFSLAIRQSASILATRKELSPRSSR